ncbi:UPF0104 family protein [Natrarchaeobius halalkaliphilus]|uniref:UPF0104 family protein n=1 Tax=Natrarchaeobius halalkaliphilus TaxID=1679091 RepID=A0A3N6NYA5_9EURY|nr:lysylphosphatidylglycerol synthase transmembrane domain-containing protein [Natrarchaeobius halalkaliphilus]RQG89789.1 UPF0104 family protein [Natrarchaeobius halalkaliphilus]
MKGRITIAFGISVVLLGFLILAVGWESVLASIGQATLRIYAVAFLAISGCLLFRALVWHRVLSVVDRPRPYWLVSGIVLTATFAKYVAPYGLVTSGVGVAAVVSRYYDSAYEEGLAATVSADFLNYLPYYSFGAVGASYVLFVYSPSIPLRQYTTVGVLVGSGVIALVLVAWRSQRILIDCLLRILDSARRVVARVSSTKSRHLRRENLSARFEGFSTTVELVSRNRSSMAIALVYAHLAWLGLAIALYATAQAVAMPIPFGVAILGVALSKLGFLVPTPGGVGGVEFTLASVLYLLTPMGMAIATSIAILFRFASYWFPMCLGGVISMALTLSDPLPPDAE